MRTLHCKCIYCGYDLYSLRMDACCPECGQYVSLTWDPKRIVFWSNKHLRKLILAPLLWMLIHLFPTLSFVTYLMWPGPVGFDHQVIVVLPFLMMGIACLILMSSLERMVKSTAAARVARWAGLLISLSYFGGAYSIPAEGTTRLLYWPSTVVGCLIMTGAFAGVIYFHCAMYFLLRTMRAKRTCKFILLSLVANVLVSTLSLIIDSGFESVFIVLLSAALLFALSMSIAAMICLGSLLRSPPICENAVQ